jgi:hypothetical protein
MSESNAAENQYAVPSERDRFLRALDQHDDALSAQLAIHLTGCSNPLPSSTCIELSLPIGSSYGSAARQVLRSNESRLAELQTHSDSAGVQAVEHDGPRLAAVGRRFP